MTSTLITGIAELVTNDDELAGADHSEGLGLVPDAAVIVEDDRVLWVGAAARHPRPTVGSTLAAARLSPASSTATRTWCSPVTGPRNSRPG